MKPPFYKTFLKIGPILIVATTLSWELATTLETNYKERLIKEIYPETLTEDDDMDINYEFWDYFFSLSIVLSGSGFWLKYYLKQQIRK